MPPGRVTWRGWTWCSPVAFSEFAAQIGGLHSASARAEINAIDRATGQIVIADRAMTRAVDLAENIAAKTALEIAGRDLAIRVLEHLVATLPEPEADEGAAADAEQRPPDTARATVEHPTQDVHLAHPRRAARGARDPSSLPRPGP